MITLHSISINNIHIVHSILLIRNLSVDIPLPHPTSSWPCQILTLIIIYLYIQLYGLFSLFFYTIVVLQYFDESFRSITGNFQKIKYLRKNILVALWLTNIYSNLICNYKKPERKTVWYLKLSWVRYNSIWGLRLKMCNR